MDADDPGRWNAHHQRRGAGRRKVLQRHISSGFNAARAAASAGLLWRRPRLVAHQYGSDPYAKEELVAELGGAFLCGHTGIVDRTINSLAAYLEGWLKSLKQDRTLIVQAAAQAQKAADFILGHKPEQPAEDIIPKISLPPKPAEVMA